MGTFFSKLCSSGKPVPSDTGRITPTPARKESPSEKLDVPEPIRQYTPAPSNDTGLVPVTGPPLSEPSSKIQEDTAEITEKPVDLIVAVTPPPPTHDPIAHNPWAESPTHTASNPFTHAQDSSPKQDATIPVICMTTEDADDRSIPPPYVVVQASKVEQPPYVDNRMSTLDPWSGVPIVLPPSPSFAHLHDAPQVNPKESMSGGQVDDGLVPKQPKQEDPNPIITDFKDPLDKGPSDRKQESVLADVTDHDDIQLPATPKSLEHPIKLDLPPQTNTSMLAPEAGNFHRNIDSTSSKEEILKLSLGVVNVLGMIGGSTSILAPLKMICTVTESVLEIALVTERAKAVWRSTVETLEQHKKMFHDQLARVEAADMAPDPDSPILAPLKAYSLELERTFRALLEEQRIREEGMPNGFQPVKDFLRKSVSAKTGGDWAGGYSSKLNDAMNQLTVSLTIYMGFTVYSINQKLSQIEAKLGGSEIQSVTAQGVQHQECLPQTRTEVLESIESWSNSPDAQPRVYCLGDIAGTGKSTVANHLAKGWHNRGRLVARFFFSRGSAGVSTAYDLSPHFARTMRKRFPQIARSNDDIQALSTSSIEEQWQELVVEPLLQLEDKSLVMIIDGLDQCSEDSRKILLRCILETFGSDALPNVKLFLTTRLESDIKPLLVSAGDSVRIESLQQHESNLKDVSHYIRHRFSTMRPPKMNDQDARSLEKRANGLFVFAATACNLLERSFQRGEALKRILAADGFTSLDGLYLEVLRRAVDVEDRSSLDSLKKVLGIVISAKEPLSVDEITRLLSRMRPVIHVGSIVDNLASVLSSGSPNDPIRILHPTFREFLLHVKRSGQYAISRHAGNSILATACLQMLSDLKPDMCRLIKPNSPLPLNKSVPNLPSRIEESVPSVLRYAASNWVAHTLPVLHKADICELMRQFFKKKLLPWIEFGALYGKTAELMHAIHQLQSGIETRLQLYNCVVHDTDQQWCTDTLDFLRRTQSLLNLSALHVYSSALTFTATNSLVYQHYHSMFRAGLPFVPGGIASRAIGQTILHGHHGHVTGIVFSPDGTMIASTSSDGSLLLWNTDTAALISTYYEQQSALHCVTFSPDGSFAISGSEGGHIQKWHGQTGDRVGMMWEEGNDPILAVTWSPDGTRVTFGTEGGTICEIDAESGNAFGGSAQHTGAVNGLAYSRGGRFIASASSDTTVRIWNTSLKKGLAPRPIVFSHSSEVYCVALSPSRQHLASCADAFYIWNIETGEAIFRSEALGISRCVAYSPDGNRVVTGSDHEIHQRDALTGSLSKNVFTGHTDDILALAYSPNGKTIVSASKDKSARIWKATQGKNAVTLTKHQGRVQHLAFSHDGSSVVSVASDGTLGIWNAKDGTLKKGPVPLPSSYISPVAYHPDGKRIALVGSPNGLQLWTTLGAGLKKASLLPVHLDDPAQVHSIIFSPNGQYVAIKAVVHFAQEQLSIWKLSKVDSKSPKVELVLQVSVEDGPLAFHRSNKFVCCAGHAWDLTESPPELVNHKDLDDMITDTFMSPLHYQRDHGFDWIEVGSPAVHSFAVPKEIDVFSHAIQESTIALGSRDGRVIFVDCSGPAGGVNHGRTRSLNNSARDAVPGH